MSSKNTFEGLQFRIMETLEKQKGVPLTVVEIANRLHETEYRNEMMDNVIFKVTRAVHSMTQLGKILTSDSRDREGRLCYQLPNRMKFTSSSAAPVNPVLKPEVAAQIKTVEPKPERPTARAIAERVKKTGGRAQGVPGIHRAVLTYIDRSPHPVTSRDVTAALGHLYADQTTDEKKLRLIFAGHLNYLSKQQKPSRKVMLRKAVGIPEVRYEYYTKKTGAASHPLQKKPKGDPVAMQRERLTTPKRAAPPFEETARFGPIPEGVYYEKGYNRFWKQTTPTSFTQITSTAFYDKWRARQEEFPDYEEVWDKLGWKLKAPVKAETKRFRPRSVEEPMETVTFRTTVSNYNKMKTSAATAKITLTEFIRQAVEYALADLDLS